MLTEHTKKTLQELRQYLSAEPRRIDMNEYGHAFDPLDDIEREVVAEALDRPDSDLPPCGTVGCMAGNIIFMTTPLERIQELIKVDGDFFELCDGGFVWETASRRLGITNHEASRLFFFQNHGARPFDGAELNTHWPLELEREYAKVKTPAERLAVVLKRIDAFEISEGQV